jgi:hypothetical protein
MLDVGHREHSTGLADSLSAFSRQKSAVQNAIDSFCRQTDLVVSQSDNQLNAHTNRFTLPYFCLFAVVCVSNFRYQQQQQQLAFTIT